MAADTATLPRPVYLDLIEEHAARAHDHRRRARGLLVLPALAGFIVGMGATVTFLPIWIAALIGIAVGACVAGWALRAAPGSVLRRLNAVPAAPGELVRIDNMLDELSLTVGVTRPAVYCVEDPAVEAMVFGLDDRRASLVVTSGLVGQLDTMELEALLGHALVRIKDLTMVPGTVAVTALVPFARILPPLGRFVWSRCCPEPVEETDLRSVRVTRYPPALISALDKVAEVAPERRESVGHLWTAPRPAASALPVTAVGVGVRCAMLQEL